MKTKTRITTTMLLIATGFAAQCMPGVSKAGVLVTDPDDVGNDINTLGVTMSEEVGNTSLATFNKLGLQRTFTMDTPSHPASPQTVKGNSFELTSGGSGVDKVLNMSASGGDTFFQFNAATDPRQSSGNQSLVLGPNGNRTTTFLFDTAVQAFGFTAHRLAGDDLTVNLYSDSGGSTLIDSFVMSENSSDDHSFFGYTSGAQNILRIDLVGGATTLQYWIDDVSFANHLAGTVVTIK
jgi:hypothetical protein